VSGRGKSQVAVVRCSHVYLEVAFFALMNDSLTAEDVVDELLASGEIEVSVF